MHLKQMILVNGNAVALKSFSLKRWPSNVYIDRKGNIAGHDFDAASAGVLDEKVRSLLATRP